VLEVDIPYWSAESKALSLSIAQGSSSSTRMRRSSRMSAATSSHSSDQLAKVGAVEVAARPRMAAYSLRRCSSADSFWAIQ